MDIKREKIKEGIQKALEHKGKRKFKQSLELIVNFKGIDFTKPENRINLKIKLPKGKGKENKIVVIGDESTTYAAKNAGADVTIKIDELDQIDTKEIKKLANNHVFLAQPKAIGQVAKRWAKVLGPRGKLPIPLIGKVENAIKDNRNLVLVQTKGKFMPVVQTVIGTEDMNVEELVENAMSVLDEITKKVQSGNIKSIYFKLSMGKPVKVV